MRMAAAAFRCARLDRKRNCYLRPTSMIFWALPLFWLACAPVGYFYILHRGILSSVVLAPLPAFLLEATFFLTLGVESWRKRLEKLRPVGVAAVLVVAAVAPDCAASLAFGSFRWQ